MLKNVTNPFSRCLKSHPPSTKWDFNVVLRVSPESSWLCIFFIHKTNARLTPGLKSVMFSFATTEKGAFSSVSINSYLLLHIKSAAVVHRGKIKKTSFHCSTVCKRTRVTSSLECVRAGSKYVQLDKNTSVNLSQAVKVRGQRSGGS